MDHIILLAMWQSTSRAGLLPRLVGSEIISIHYLWSGILVKSMYQDLSNVINLLL